MSDRMWVIHIDDDSSGDARESNTFLKFCLFFALQVAMLDRMSNDDFFHRRKIQWNDFLKLWMRRSAENVYFIEDYTYTIIRIKITWINIDENDCFELTYVYFLLKERPGKIDSLIGSLIFTHTHKSHTLFVFGSSDRSRLGNDRSTCQHITSSAPLKFDCRCQKLRCFIIYRNIVCETSTRWHMQFSMHSQWTTVL